MKLGQWLLIHTEDVGSHDGFLKANKSDETLELFLTQSEGNTFRVTKCKLLLLWTLKSQFDFKLIQFDHLQPSWGRKMNMCNLKIVRVYPKHPT
jgi:hypothetical protein